MSDQCKIKILGFFLTFGLLDKIFKLWNLAKKKNQQKNFNFNETSKRQIKDK